MKIAMILDKVFTEANSDLRVYKEAKSLHNHGHEITIFSFGKNGIPSVDTIDGIHIQRWNSSPSRLQRYLRYPRKISFFTFCISAIIRQKFDAVHCHDLTTLPVGLSLKYLKPRIFFVYDSHEFFLGQDLPYWSAQKKKIYERVERKALHKIDHLIAVNKSVHRLLQNKYKLKVSCSIVMNCVDIHHFYPRKEAQQLREKLHLQNKLIVGHLGHLCDIRGQWKFPDLIQDVISKDQNVAFVFIGTMNDE